MKKHKFKAGDGMKRETSTREQRKEIHQLLECNGYKVIAKTKRRNECDFERELLFESSEFYFPFDKKVTNNYTYQEMKDLILGKKEETITVTRSELIDAIRKEFASQEPYVDLIFSRVKELQSKLPVIELKGANKEINYVSKDRLIIKVYGYRNRPEYNNIEWSDKESCISLDGLDQTQFEAIKSMDWKNSLHKVKHI